MASQTSILRATILDVNGIVCKPSKYTGDANLQEVNVRARVQFRTPDALVINSDYSNRLRFLTGDAKNGRKYRAVWSNQSRGTDLTRLLSSTKTPSASSTTMSTTSSPRTHHGNDDSIDLEDQVHMYVEMMSPVSGEKGERTSSALGFSILNVPMLQSESSISTRGEAIFVVLPIRPANVEATFVSTPKLSNAGRKLANLRGSMSRVRSFVSKTSEARSRNKTNSVTMDSHKWSIGPDAVVRLKIERVPIDLKDGVPTQDDYLSRLKNLGTYHNTTTGVVSATSTSLMDIDDNGIDYDYHYEEDENERTTDVSDFYEDAPLGPNELTPPRTARQQESPVNDGDETGFISSLLNSFCAACTTSTAGHEHDTSFCATSYCSGKEYDDDEFDDDSRFLHDSQDRYYRNPGSGHQYYDDVSFLTDPTYGSVSLGR